MKTNLLPTLPAVSSSHLVSTAPSSSGVGLLILFQHGVPPKLCNVILSQGLRFFMNCSTPSLTPTQPNLCSDKTLISISTLLSSRKCCSPSTWRVVLKEFNRTFLFTSPLGVNFWKPRECHSSIVLKGTTVSHTFNIVTVS